VNHVLELFRNLEINRKKKAWIFFWNYNLICEEIATSKFILYCLFSILILNIIQTKGVPIQFHINTFMQWDEPIKRFNPKQKKKLCKILKYLPPQPTYLPK
jgi:hypothetical protein